MKHEKYCIKSKYGCPYKDCNLHDCHYWEDHSVMDCEPEYIETGCLDYLDE